MTTPGYLHKEELDEKMQNMAMECREWLLENAHFINQGAYAICVDPGLVQRFESLFYEIRSMNKGTYICLNHVLANIYHIDRHRTTICASDENKLSKAIFLNDT
jgi:hypothetical protein